MFLKLNLVSAIRDLYFEMFIDGVFCDNGRTEEKLLLIHEIGRCLQEIELNSNSFPHMCGALGKMISWIELKDALKYALKLSLV